MKRLLIPLLILALLLCACGSAAENAPEQESPAEEPAEEPESCEPPILPIGAVGAGDNTELPILPEPAGEEPALGGTELTLDGISSYLRVTLPEGWTWEETEAVPDGRVFTLRPAGGGDYAVELRWWADGFGMCGTGVSMEDYVLPNGRTATLATETIRNSLIWTLILPPSPDAFTVQICADQALFEEHRPELDLMLGSLRQGVLAQQTPVTENAPDA